jgi:hypothetical protein
VRTSEYNGCDGESTIVWWIGLGEVCTIHSTMHILQLGVMIFLSNKYHCLSQKKKMQCLLPNPDMKRVKRILVI